MQVVWEADTAAFASRKRAARACQQCQKRKKRCHHTFSKAPDQRAESDGADKILPNLTHKEPIRFVGDLNPESILTDLSTRSKGQTRISRVGTWIEQSREAQNGLTREELGITKSGEKTPVNVEKYGKFEGGRRILTSHQRNYLQAVGAFRVLPKATQDVLITTYFACIDGILPIMDGTKLLRDYGSGKVSIFLIQAICLVTCKNEDAAPYLRLYEDGPLLDPIPFARSIHTGLDAAMKADLEPDRVTKIQILTLMHLHNDGPGGIEESSLHLSQAIHDAWTAGLHIQTPGRSTKDESSMLWWTIWALDRINACLGGRPMMIADRDIDIGRPPLESGLKSQSINLWLRLGDLFDKVIEFYRPTVDLNATGWETQFPSYSEMTKDIDLDVLLETHRVVLELVYNVIAILSCRAGGPNTASYARRVVAADRIQQLMYAATGHHHVPAIPLIPYAVSLSLTVAYRGLRDNHNDVEQISRDLTTRCEILESLSKYWWTADAMAKLGRKALKSLQQPGIRRKSIADIANAMEAEVTACKFGPFEPKANQVIGMNIDNSEGSGLQLLSDAAATHANTNLAIPLQTSIGQSPLTEHIPSTTDSGLAPFTPSALDVGVFDQFNNLDNLFDGFFDLSMPTIFQDPLFDGAAFLSEKMGNGDDSEPFQNHQVDNMMGLNMGIYGDQLQNDESNQVSTESNRKLDQNISDYPDILLG